MFNQIMTWVVVYFTTHGGMKLGTIWTLTAIAEMLDAISIMALAVVAMFMVMLVVDCINAGWSKYEITENQLSGITLKVLNLVERI